MGYLFAGYLVLWAITFGYIFSIHSRQKQLQRDWERLTHASHQSAQAAGETSERRKES